MRLILCTLFLAVTAVAQPAPAPNDYAEPKAWLCRPGQHDACQVDLSTTIVTAGGKLTRENWKANPNAPIDCFYVYPTVSTDTTPNSDMSPDPAELNVIRQQFARLASKCRPFATSYRQITLAGLRRMLAAPVAGTTIDRGIQYDDVRDAWNYYLEHDNQGRGFVLVGHSQGSFILARLIREEIDGKPVQSRLISAILPGTTIAVPRGKDVGGAFQHVPVCRSPAQTGCVIVFASYRSNIPPPADTLFGKVAAADMTAACTNPAALAGGSGELHAYLSATGATIASVTPPKPWVIPEKTIGTPWVSVPGLLTAECKTNANATYLEVTLHPNPSGRRTSEILGDLTANGQIQANWGLHLIDMNLAMGNVLDIVDRQSKAFLKSSGKR